MQEIGGFRSAAVSLLLLAAAAFCLAQQADKRESQIKEDGQAQPFVAQSSQPQQQSMVTQPTLPTEIVLAEPAQAQRRVQPIQQQKNWQQHGASHLISQRRTWAQRGGYQGYRIPHADFGRHFGKNHSFHVSGLPFKEVGGRPRFEYGGYWFSLMEPYPEYWGADWYRNDDMYVDYGGGGYYLYDRRYSNRPGVAVSITF